MEAGLSPPFSARYALNDLDVAFSSLQWVIRATSYANQQKSVASRDNRHIIKLDLTWALSILVDHSPQTTCLHPALSCAAASIFHQLYLKPAVHVSFSRSLSTCSLVALYFCGPAVSTVVLVWQCCRFFSMCVQASFIFFFLAELVQDQKTILLCNIGALALS